MKELIETIDKRSEGFDVKSKCFQVQYLSALIFIPMAFILYSKYQLLYFSIIFLSEGLGQIFLARENQLSLREGNLRIKYFREGTLGFLAILIFAPAILLRYVLITEYTESFNTPLLIFGSVTYLAAIIHFKMGKGRKDLPMGLLFIISSLSLGLGHLILDINIELGINQILYSLLLGMGVLFFKAWMAELLNIILWIHLFWILGQS